RKDNLAAMLLGLGDEEVRSNKGPGNHLINMTWFMTNLGHQVFLRMPSDLLLRFIPFHDVMFTPRNRHIRVHFRSLRQAKGPGGTVYYSRHEPKLEVDGQKLIVAFSGHAIQRTCERLAYRWPSYSALGNVFALFDQCLEFERCELHPATLGFTFFDQCAPGYWNYSLAGEGMGEHFRPGEDYCIRVGYCPAVIEGCFIKAKTLLFPGFASTPEYGKMLSANLPRDRKQAMLEEAKVLNARNLSASEGRALLKWFHDR